MMTDQHRAALRAATNVLHPCLLTALLPVRLFFIGRVHTRDPKRLACLFDSRVLVATIETITSNGLQATRWNMFEPTGKKGFHRQTGNALSLSVASF